MAESLIEFWKRCSLENPPFAHPDDRKALGLESHTEAHRSHWSVDDEPKDHDSYIKSPRFGAPVDDRLHLSLLPIPYVGNLREAEIVVLLLNPGFQHSEYWAETKGPGLRDRLKRNLNQSFDEGEAPFFCLDPQFCWYGGFQWWEKKLRSVLQLIASNRPDKSYLKALEDLSHRLACLELVPYHSASFGVHKLIKELPSVRKAQEFVRDSLIPAAAAKKRTIIVTRQAAEWGMKDQLESDNLIVYRGGQTRAASLGPDTDGGRAILRRYGIRPPQQVSTLSKTFSGIESPFQTDAF